MIKKEVKEIDNLICDLIQKTSKRIKEKAKINNNYQLLALFFFSKVAKSYRAVERLCYSGYGQDALVLGRTIFEHMVTLSYINKDPGERVELFIDHHKFQARKRLETRDEIYPEETITISQEVRNARKADHEKLKGKYPNQNRWSGKNVRDMSKECELETKYKLFYPFASSYVHGEVVTSPDYIQREDSMINLNLGQPTTDRVDLAMISTCYSVIIFLEQLCIVFDVEPPEECLQAIDRINGLPRELYDSK